MVRRYQQLLEEIKNQQRFTHAEWTQKTIDALLGEMTIVDKNDSARITYEEWRQWQERLAKRYGWDGSERRKTEKSMTTQHSRKTGPASP